MVLNVPMSVAPGPFSGARPVAQIGRYGRQAEVIRSPGAEMSGQVVASEALPREEKPDSPLSRLPVPPSL